MKKLALVTPLILCLILSGCNFTRSRVKNTYFALDTVITTEIHGKDAMDVDGWIFSDINTIGAVLDAEALPTGFVSKDAEHVYPLLRFSMFVSRLTGGAFDVSVGGYVEAWGFSDKNYRIPTTAELDEIKAKSGYGLITETNDGYRLPDGCKITFGAIAKGYIADIIYHRLETGDIDKAIISLGGNVIAYGKDGDDPWKVGIESPSGDGSCAAVLDLTDCFAITSGDYHRNFTQDGKTYHHIIDPATGCPAESDLRSVTIVGKSGTLADALSTALFVMGSEKAAQLWQSGAAEFDFVMITKSGEMLVSQGLEGLIHDVADGYTLSIVKK